MATSRLVSGCLRSVNLRARDASPSCGPRIRFPRAFGNARCTTSSRMFTFGGLTLPGGPRSSRVRREQRSAQRTRRSALTAGINGTVAKDVDELNLARELEGKYSLQ